MSISITITDITNLTDTERAVLRFVADRATANSLKEAVRGMAGHTAACGHESELGRIACDDCSGAAIERVLSAEPLHNAPVEPEEVYSPHAVVLDTPTPWVAPAAPAPSGSAELDANGLPWDKRIHASTRTKVAAGTWKYARGVDGDYIKTVERELRAVQDIPVPVVSNVAPDGYSNTPVPYTVPSAVAPIVPLLPVPAAPTAAPIMTFAQLMQHITPMLVSGKLTQPMLQQVVGTLGLPHLAALGARPDLVETVRMAIDAAVGGVQ